LPIFQPSGPQVVEAAAQAAVVSAVVPEPEPEPHRLLAAAPVAAWPAHNGLPLRLIALIFVGHQPLPANLPSLLPFLTQPRLVSALSKSHGFFALSLGFFNPLSKLINAFLNRFTVLLLLSRFF